MTEQATVPAKRGDGRLARFEPLDLLERFHDEMERWWGQTWPRPLTRLAPRPVFAPGAWAPRLDVFEKDGLLVIKAELPGVKKDDIQVALEQGDLVIRGERQAEQAVKEEDYYRCERSYGSFYRHLPLAFEAKPEQIKAEYKDGVLEIRIPKPTEPTPPTYRIEVR